MQHGVQPLIDAGAGFRFMTSQNRPNLASNIMNHPTL
jgi:hypothetical protein